MSHEHLNKNLKTICLSDTERCPNAVNVLKVILTISVNTHAAGYLGVNCLISYGIKIALI